jgi:hypothetical protein
MVRRFTPPLTSINRPPQRRDCTMIHRNLVALFCFVAATFRLSAGDFTGIWEGIAMTPEGEELKIIFNFTEKDGKLTGTTEAVNYGTFPANDIVVDGDKITFNVPTDGGTYFNTGTLKPDGLLVEGTGPDGPYPPVLYKRPAANLTGKWRGQVQTPDGPADIVYTFETREGKTTGVATGPFGDVPLTNIAIEGNRVAFESDYSGFSVKRRGTVQGDTMQLTISIDGNDVSATFTREPVAAPSVSP